MYVVQIFIKYVWRDFRLPCNGNKKYRIGKSVFALNLPLELFRVTVTNANIGSLNSFHTFFTKYLYMLVKFKQIVKSKTIQNFELFDKK